MGADIAWCSGSYTSPLTHSRCSKTASFRATATAARFFAFFPPRSQSRSPYRRRSVSGPNGPKIYCYAITKSIPVIVLAAFSERTKEELINEGAAACVEKSDKLFESDSVALIHTVTQVVAKAKASRG
jgi:hypothetical protein